MKNLKDVIVEKFIITKDTKRKYNYHPKTKEELRKILEERLAKDKNANLNDIDVSEITDMSCLFERLDPHNIDISEWHVDNVTNMYSMFFGCRNLNFNSDLNKWHVIQVTDMKYIFYDCRNLKNIPSWLK